MSSRVFRSSFPSAELSDFRTREWRHGVAQSASELKPHYPTITHAFFHAGQVADDVGITIIPESPGDPEEHRSYASLCVDAHHMAQRLAARGIRKGDRVLIVLPTSFEFLVAFTAIGLLRAVPVPTYPPSMLERAEIALRKMQRIADHADVKATITNRKLMLLIGELATADRPIITVESMQGDGAKGPVERRVRSNDPAFIQYTSGSTGHPKGVLLKHRAICSNIHAIGQALQINRHDVTVGWLPLYHDMGLIGVLLFSIYWRIPLVLMSPTTFLMDPVRWLKAISDHRGTLSPAPNFGYARCIKRVHESELEGIDLSSWRMALNGAEPVNLDTLEAFIAKFEPHGFQRDTFLPVYGLAESSLAVSFPPPGSPLQYEVVDRVKLAGGDAVPVAERGPGSMALVSVGSAIPGHEVIVVDERGEELGERQVGHVVVRGPSLMAGYFKDSAATHNVLHSDVLWTGDLGYFADGNLYITGRVKDLIIVRGKNYYAEDVEAVAERVPGVRAGCCVAFGIYDEEIAGDLLVIVAETKLNDEADRVAAAENVASVVQEECGLRVDEVALVEPGVIPKTSSGKRQRALCRELYIRGELNRQRTTSKLKLAWVFARSGVGFASAKARELLTRRPSED